MAEELGQAGLVTARAPRGWTPHPLSATSLALSGRGKRGWLQGDGFTGPHDYSGVSNIGYIWSFEEGTYETTVILKID